MSTTEYKFYVCSTFSPFISIYFEWPLSGTHITNQKALYKHTSWGQTGNVTGGLVSISKKKKEKKNADLDVYSV